MSTASDLISDTRRYLEANSREELNRLSADIADVDSTLTFDFSARTSIAPGAWLAIDLEVLYVWDVVATTATVQRAMLGSTAAFHAAGSVITVNPKVSDFAIFAALNGDIASLSSPANGLYRIATYDFAGNAATSGYDLPVSGLIDVLDVRYQDYGPTLDWPRLRRWSLQRDADTTAFASGQALFFYEGLAPGRTVQVTVAVELGPLADQYSDVADTGLPSTAYDIPPLGAAARILTGRESNRSSVDAQPEPRTAAEVPPGTARNAASTLLALRQQRVREESARLHARHPRMRRSA